jgi:hypothetical protein
MNACIPAGPLLLLFVFVLKKILYLLSKRVHYELLSVPSYRRNITTLHIGVRKETEIWLRVGSAVGSKKVVFSERGISHRLPPSVLPPVKFRKNYTVAFYSL